jgi:hypothetical protein
MRFTIPDYGVIESTATGKGVDTILPAGEVPVWVKDNPRKLDVRPTLDRRVQVTKTKIEVHNYFGGWENFWFPVQLAAVRQVVQRALCACHERRPDRSGILERLFHRA